MQLHDRYDGSDDPFEGERTIVWRSLPANAIVTKATLTLEPARRAGNCTYTETLRFAKDGPTYGETIRPATGPAVEIDFHARRTAISFAGLNATGPLAVDIGGGVFLAVGADGTIPAVPPGSSYTPSQGALPGITAVRLRLGVSSSDSSSDNFETTTVEIASMPSNLTLRFGALPPFWSKNGELAVQATTPDVTSAVQRALTGATVENGYVAIPLIVHSDTLGRLIVKLDVEYLGAAPLVPTGLREIILPYDYASLPKTEATALQATLPAGAVIVSPHTALQVRGTFAASRVTDGPTGATNELPIPLCCSATETLAQPVIPGADVDVSAVDLFIASTGPAARLALDLRVDDDGKPGQASTLAKPAPFDLAGDARGDRQWTSVPISPPARLGGNKRYWLVVQALNGAANLGVEVTPDPTRLVQRSTDAGFSWRLAGTASPLLLRLRTIPDRFHIPIDFAVGTGPAQRRVSLSAYDPLGKIDMVVDRPEIAAAVQFYLAQAAPPTCAHGELLKNADFSQWSTVGSTLACVTQIPPPQARSWLVVDTFFDKVVAQPQVALRPPTELVFSADGSMIFAVEDGHISVIDASTYALKHPVPPLDGGAVALAVDPSGGTLYILGTKKLTAVDLSTGNPTPVFNTFDKALALALSPDGRTAYVACTEKEKKQPSVIALDLETDIVRARVDVGASALAVTADGKTLVAIDSERQIAAFDALSGSPEWTASLLHGPAYAIAAAADGTSIYGIGTGENGKLDLVAFNQRGGMTQQLPFQPPPNSRDYVLAVKPQGDRVYVSPSAMALNPTGDRLVATGPVAVIAVGRREPAAWTLTAGTATAQPSSDEPARTEAQLKDGALSQVVPAAPACFHDLIVEATLKPDGSPDAIVELFWLDARGALLRRDSLALPTSNRDVTRRTRVTSPAGTAQAEVRIRVAGGTGTLRSVSLTATDALLQDDAWQPDPATPSRMIVTSNATGTTYRNGGTADAARVQHIALDPSATYELDFSGSATPGPANANPYLELRYFDANGTSVGAPQQIPIASIGFADRPAQLAIPSTSTAADLRIALPAAATLTVERLQVLPRQSSAVPVTFIAQSPGELHVSNAQIVYDLQPTPGPSPPASGLSTPTPPDRTPGDPTCRPDPSAAPSTTAETAKRSVLPPPVRPTRTIAVAAPQSIPIVQKEQPLTEIEGIGFTRAQRLRAAGIGTIRVLAASTPERITAALAAPTVATTLIERANTALTATPPTEPSSQELAQHPTTPITQQTSSNAASPSTTDASLPARPSSGSPPAIGPATSPAGAPTSTEPSNPSLPGSEQPAPPLGPTTMPNQAAETRLLNYG